MELFDFPIYYLIFVVDKNNDICTLVYSEKTTETEYRKNIHKFDETIQKARQKYPFNILYSMKLVRAPDNNPLTGE